jgi:2-polyprenyl-3-methyl-5-hydroxy-6-metoxy-1,4-benzoquinol methylase
MYQCHICNSIELVSLRQPDHLKGVTSDCKPWKNSPEIVICQNCGNAISITSEKWFEDINQIYANYEIYRQGSFKDHKLFYDKSSMSRSSKLIEGLSYNNLLSINGNLLEIGPGEGNLLKEFSLAFPDWDLYVSDFNDNAKERISSEIPIKGFFSGDISKISSRFDLVTLVHSLEHIPNPTSYLSKIKSLLKPGGKLLVNVPNCLTNPFVLCVADHCTHFVPKTLNQLVEKAEFEIIFSTTSLISKELFIVAENNLSRQIEVEPIQYKPPIKAFNNHFDWLSATVNHLKGVPLNDNFGCLGTTIAGTWVFSQLGNRLNFFVDEDVGRQGNTHLNIPILSPTQVPQGSKLFLAFPYAVAESIAHKYKDFDFEVILPPKPSS